MRAKILDVARELFGSKGYTVTSIADITNVLGVTKGALYYHFASKEAILDTLVKEPAAELTEIARDAAGRDPRELLGQLVDLQARYPAAYMALHSGDPSVLQEYSQAHDFQGKTERITLAIAGPDASPGRVIRAQMAVAAAKEGTMAALIQGNGALADGLRSQVLHAAAATLETRDEVAPSTPSRAVRSLGEVALRVNDLGRMREFYEQVVGLELMREFPGVAFFRLGDGYGGHTTILALFDRDTAVEIERTTLDHLAFTIDVADYESERQRLEAAGLTVRRVVFDWVGWRSLFIEDPEGNHVEFVCRDPALTPE
jgi:AcrR family transcriptional regulator